MQERMFQFVVSPTTYQLTHLHLAQFNHHFVALELTKHSLQLKALKIFT